MDKTERKRTFIINCLYAALIAGIIYVCFKYLLGIIMPFFIAFVIVMLLNPLVKWICIKTPLKKNLVFSVILIVFYALVGYLIILVGIKIITALGNLFVRLPNVYTQSVAPAIAITFEKLKNFFNALDPALSVFLNDVSDNIISSLGSIISNVSVKIVTWVTDYATTVPGTLINILISIISAFFLAIDLEVFNKFFSDRIPQKTYALFSTIKNELGETLLDYTKSYALILFITCSELAVGLSIVGIKNAVLVALIIAVFDILPIVGTGMVMLPWTIIEFITGNIGRGIGIGIVYLVVVIVRQIIEPKIVGNKVGLNALVTLMAMVIGLKLFGAFGLLGLPVALALLNSMEHKGIIHIFNKKDEVETGMPDGQDNADSGGNGI
jgi:sporulation integral membrane protein YtvI